MTYGRRIMMIIAVFLCTVGVDMFVHRGLLQDIYTQTPHLWRSWKAMYTVLQYMHSSQFLYAVSMVLFYDMLNKRARHGLSPLLYGVMTGCIVGSLQIATYAYMPISLSVMIAWVLAALGHGVVSGCVMAVIERCGTKSDK